MSFPPFDFPENLTHSTCSCSRSPRWRWGRRYSEAGARTFLFLSQTLLYRFGHVTHGWLKLTLFRLFPLQYLYFTFLIIQTSLVGVYTACCGYRVTQMTTDERWRVIKCFHTTHQCFGSASVLCGSGSKLKTKCGSGFETLLLTSISGTDGHFCWNSRCRLQFIVCQARKTKVRFHLQKKNNSPFPFSVCIKQTEVAIFR